MARNGIERIFDMVGMQLPKAGIEFLMIGGHAVNYYGYSRATIDVDFMIAASDISAVRSVMKDAGFTNISESENVVFFNHPQIPFRVDFLQVDGSTMKALMVDAESIDYAGQSLRVPSLSNLIAMKLFALKNGSAKREEKDFPDIVNLVMEHELDVDADLKPLCDKFADEAIFEKLSKHIRELTDD
jgi:predicted nucleotidyltransferase